jgi:hypothetical protein
MRSKFLCSLTLLTAFSVVAQTPSTPQLDELTKTKADLLATQMQLVNTQESQLEQQKQKIAQSMQELIIGLEKKYPGFTLDLKTGLLTAKQPTAQIDPHTGLPIGTKPINNKPEIMKTPEEKAAEKQATTTTKTNPK